MKEKEKCKTVIVLEKLCPQKELGKYNYTKHDLW